MTFQELWNELEQEDPIFIKARKKAQIQEKLIEFRYKILSFFRRITHG